MRLSKHSKTFGRVMKRRRWTLWPPQPPPKRQLKGIKKAIARRKREELARLMQWRLQQQQSSMEEADAKSGTPSSPSPSASVGGLDAVKKEATEVPPSPPTPMEIATPEVTSARRSRTRDDASSSSSSSTDSSSSSTSGVGSGEGSSGGGTTNPSNNGSNGKAAQPLTEEERAAKVRELEKRLEQMGEQKHKLFLLLKQVLFVDEKKRKKLAEEERARLEEQRRYIRARTPMHWCARC